jgi:uncharacterized protein YjiS (DUF1127 family)
MMRERDDSSTLIRPKLDKEPIFRHNGDQIMILSFVKYIRKNRIAARNIRILSALDDDILSDIGLDRRTLRAFCENGCSHMLARPSQPEASRTIALPTTLGIAVR